MTAKKELIQSVVVVLSDNTKLFFTGPKQIDPKKDTREIVNVYFTPPVELPDGFNIISVEEKSKW